MKKDADWKILATLGFLVATVAVPTVASLVTPETVDASPSPKAISSQEGPRTPASAAAASSVSHVINFDLECAQNKKLEFKTQGTFVQIKGRDCRKKGAQEAISITNKTNGFTASIFPSGSKEFQTDLIQLAAGENLISVRFKTAAGAAEEQVLNVKATE